MWNCVGVSRSLSSSAVGRSSVSLMLSACRIDDTDTHRDAGQDGGPTWWTNLVEEVGGGRWWGLATGGVVPREAFARLFYDARQMTTIDVRPPGSRASAHRFGVPWAVASPLLAAA